MANKYVRSTDGSNTDDGSTWALAKATFSGAASAASAGDAIYLSQAHAETTAAAVTITLPGTRSLPNKVVAALDTSEPPIEISGSVVETTGASDLKIEGSGWISGISFNCGNAANCANLLINSSSTVHGNQKYELCNFTLRGSHPSSIVRFGSSGGFCSLTELHDCTFMVANAAAVINLFGEVHIYGGSIASGGVTPTNLFSVGTGGAAGKVIIRDFDFSALGASFNIFKIPGTSTPGIIQIYNCNLPAAWSGSLVIGTIDNPYWRAEMFNCDSGDTNYRLWIKDAAGGIRDETTIVRTGGASDGVTAISNKMTTNANAKIEGFVLAGADMLTWVDSIGSSKTATVEIVHDSATALTDADVWLELDYLGTSGFSLGTAAHDRITTPLTTPADQTSSSATWTTMGLTTPNKQKLEVMFTPQEVGWVRGRVMLAKASKTIYVDPKITVA